MIFPTSVNSIDKLFTGDQIVLYVVLSLLNAVLLFFASMKFILVLQQCGYHGRRYFKWLGNKDTPYMSRLMLLSLLALLFFCVLNMCFEPMPFGGKAAASFVGFGSYILFSIMYVNTEQSVNAKVPLKKTKRLVRLCITYCVLLAVITFGIISLANVVAFAIGNEVVGLLRYAVICLLPLLMPYILFVAYLINEPFEILVSRYYRKKAVQKLDGIDVIRIGVTGSAGKTSVKEILKTILSQKFRVLATPASFNTPLGIARAVKTLDSTHDIFIAEMGARSKGDIKELAQMVKPNFGVLTGINNQHLETFGSIEKTCETKFELFENLAVGGVGFFSSDNENSLKLMDKFGGEKYSAGLNDMDNLVTATEG